jgi:trans-aconitate 2-methyltransferase
MRRPSDDAWDPGRYARFREERTQPFRDLLAGTAPIPGGRAIDLGCGTGDLTAILHERSQAAGTLGVDRSEAMLAKAPSAPGLRFVRADLAEFRPDRPFDLVFSNAALQWLPAHEALFARIRDWVAPGGALAVQVPANHHHPTHALASRIATGEFGAQARTPHVLRPEEYAVLLDDLGFADVRVDLRVYLHHLESRGAVFDWVQGTLLNAFRNHVADFDAFARRYREALLAALPDKRPFPFPFPRILMWARRP